MTGSPYQLFIIASKTSIYGNQKKQPEKSSKENCQETCEEICPEKISNYPGKNQPPGPGPLQQEKVAQLRMNLKPS